MNQEPQAQRRRLAHALRGREVTGRGQGIELAARAERQRLLALRARLLAEDRDYRRFVDATECRQSEVSDK